VSKETLSVPDQRDAHYDELLVGHQRQEALVTVRKSVAHERVVVLAEVEHGEPFLEREVGALVVRFGDRSTQLACCGPIARNLPSILANLFLASALASKHCIPHLRDGEIAVGRWLDQHRSDTCKGI